jgi:hypothetical protein
MPERSPDRPHAAPRDEATRDIHLPPLPGRPVPAVPPEWASFVPAADGSAADGSAVDGPSGDGSPLDAPAAGAPTADMPAAGRDRDGQSPGRSFDASTDRLGSPSDPARRHTMAFTAPPSVQLLKVSVTPRRRRTTRVLWTLFFLILAVIVASGVYLVLTVTQR